MNVAVITTLKHNVGDDFVREGILHLLKQHIAVTELALIHKHVPITVRPEFEWLYDKGVTKWVDKSLRSKGGYVSKALEVLPLNEQSDKILNADLLVQSGAPVYWVFKGGGGAHNNEWYQPLVKRRVKQTSRKVPFINVGAGTCQPYHSDGSEFQGNAKTISYIKELYELCDVTTLRDELSQKVFRGLGLDAPVIPCPSIFARENLGLTPQAPEYVVLNYMPSGGHDFDFEQNIDAQAFEDTFIEFYKKISQEGRVILVCHNKNEEEHARRILPAAERFISESAQDYLEFYSRAQFYIGCRVHGGFATASFGRPGFIIGSDTRALMAAQIGWDNAFVNDVSLDVLLAQYEALKASGESYEESFDRVKAKAYADYGAALKPFLTQLSGQLESAAALTAR